jgi:hypothetical protein
MAQRIAQNAANSATLASILATSPQTITSPVYYTIHNLIPYDQPVATASTFVGMLYQLIMGFFIVVCGIAGLHFCECSQFVLSFPAR